MAQKKLVRAYVNAEVRDQLISGDVCWWRRCGRPNAQQAIDATPKVAFAYPLRGFSVVSGLLGDSSGESLANRSLTSLLITFCGLRWLRQLLRRHGLASAKWRGSRILAGFTSR